MPSFDTAGKEVSDLAEKIIFRHHEDLHELMMAGSPKAPALKIDFVLVQADLDGEGRPKGPAIKHQGYKALGLCKIVNLHDRSVSERGDVEIQLDASHWGDIGDEEREALLAHEIFHIVPVLDSNDAVKRDDLGRVKLRLRKHDYQFGWFTNVALRYGEASAERQQARSIFNRDEEAFFPFLAELDAQNQARSLTSMAADVADAMMHRSEKSALSGVTSVKISSGGEEIYSGTGEDFSRAVETVTQALKKERKKREPFVQPPGMVNVAGKEEHYLVLDLTGVETVAGITPLFRSAAKKAKWSELSVGRILAAVNSINETDAAAELKAMLAHYTYQPEADPKP